MPQANLNDTLINEALMPTDLSPHCDMCGTPIFLSLIEPADYDRRTFECTACRHSATVTVKYK